MFTVTVNGALSHVGLNPWGTAPFPRPTAPILMHKASRLVSSADWTYEPKWDGFRVMAMAGRPSRLGLSYVAIGLISSSSRSAGGPMRFGTPQDSSL